MVPAPSTAPERTPALLYFKTAGAHYVYDAPTNEIVRVSRDFWETTQHADFWREKGPGRGELSPAAPSDQALLDEIGAARDTGLFSDRRPKSLSLMITKDEFEKSLDSKVSQLILGVTEQCNLRCAYCTYSGQYQDQRTHANNRMAVELAQDAARFFLARNRESDATYVSFYGGEPTLNMEAIRAAVAVVEDTKRQARFSLTTNAYSLSDETLRYFVDHSFSVLASIDGPAAVHNRFRKTAGGQDTFAAAYRTLERLRAMDESFFKANVRLSAVIGPPYDIRLLQEFFDADPLFEGTSMRASTISEDSTTFFDNLKPDADIVPRSGADFASMKEDYKRNLIDGAPYRSRFLAGLFEGPFIKLQKRGLFPGYGGCHYANSQCLPGVRRMFVNPTGKILVCEKVNQTLEIGDIYRGFDLEAIERIVTTYIDESNVRCLGCVANRFCSACFADSFSARGFHADSKRQSCGNIVKSLAVNLQDYCEVLERNPSALDFMQAITIS
jgi:uncharacterized protein